MEKNDDFQYEYFSSVTQHKIEWLWYPYIPYGKLTILQGDPGEGKSTFILNIAALLTRGKNMPDGFRVPAPQRVVYQTAEDNIADTVKPRLIEAGADCDMIAYIVDDDIPLTLEDSRIEKVIEQTGARLFILDPLQGYLSQDSDMVNAGRMRSQLKRLVDVAAKYNCAVVIVGHMNKASGEKNLYRGLGSIDIAAIARSVLMISRDKENPSVRYMFPVKSSLAPEGAAVAFSLTEHLGFCWLGKREIDKAALINYSAMDNKKSIALRTISDILDGHAMMGSSIVRKLKLMDISERTINNAKKELGIVSFRKDGAWYWRLPDSDRPKNGRIDNGK